MDIKDILKKEFIGNNFKDNHNRIWKVKIQGGCTDKQTLTLVGNWTEDNRFVGYEIEKLIFLSDIVNLKFEKFSS